MWPKPPDDGFRPSNKICTIPVAVKNLPLQDDAFRGLARVAHDLEFFRSFTGEQVDRILSHVQLYGFDKGETIFKKGAAPQAFYIIYRGSVRICLGYRFCGLVKKMVHLRAGDLFGEMALIEDRNHSGTATAEQPTQLFVILKEDFGILIRNDPEFADLMKFVVSRRKFESNR